jgi:hypothetical protein
VREKVVFGLLLMMLIAFGGILITRERQAHQAPAPPAEGQVPAGSGSAAASASAFVDGGPSDAAVEAVLDAGPADAGPPKLLDRPLRVIAMGWDLAAPGLLVNGGREPGSASEFSAAGLTVHIASVDSMAAVEAAMARGGADKDGADIVIVAMPSFVASYERLRALSPEIFFVAGFSRGREAVVSAKGGLPTPPLKGEVKLAAGAAGDPASFLGLFVLDLAGIPPGDVKLAPADARADEAPFGAIDRGSVDPATSPRKTLLLTTADTPRLIPYVAVAQRGLLEKSGRAAAAWARVWLEGTRKLAADAPSGARQVTSVQGAPEPLSLLKRLGEVSPATLGDNVRMAGLSGRGALTLEALFQRTWQLWRGAGVLATPAPELPPISNAVIAALARSEPALVDPPAMRGGETDPKKGGAAADRGKTLLVNRQPEGKLDEEAFVAAAGLVAAVFERSPIRVAVHQGAIVDALRTKRLIERVQDRFDVPAGRLTPAKAVLGKGAAAVEVLAIP